MDLCNHLYITRWYDFQIWFHLNFHKLFPVKVVFFILFKFAQVHIQLTQDKIILSSITCQIHDNKIVDFMKKQLGKDSCEFFCYTMKMYRFSYSLANVAEK